jgi:hypothetical protein
MAVVALKTVQYFLNPRSLGDVGIGNEISDGKSNYEAQLEESPITRSTAVKKRVPERRLEDHKSNS